MNIIDMKETQKKIDFNYIHYRFSVLSLKGTTFLVQVEQHHLTKARRQSFYLG